MGYFDVIHFPNIIACKGEVMLDKEQHHCMS